MSKLSRTSNTSAFRGKNSHRSRGGNTSRLELVKHSIKSRIRRLLRDKITPSINQKEEPNIYLPERPFPQELESRQPASATPSMRGNGNDANPYEVPREKLATFSQTSRSVGNNATNPNPTHDQFEAENDTHHYEENIYEQIDASYGEMPELTSFKEGILTSVAPKPPSTPPPARPKNEFQGAVERPVVPPPPHRQEAAPASKIYDEAYEPISMNASADRQAEGDQNLNTLNKVISYDTRLLKAVQDLSSKDLEEEQSWSTVIKNAEVTVQNWRQTAQKRKTLPDNLFNAATSQLMGTEKALLQVYESLTLGGTGLKNAEDRNVSQALLKPQNAEMSALKAREQKGMEGADEFLEITRL